MQSFPGFSSEINGFSPSRSAFAVSINLTRRGTCLFSGGNFIISNVLYLSVPLIVQALLKGANPATTALGAGAQGAATAIGMAMGAKFAAGQLGASGAAANLLGTAANGVGALTQGTMRDSSFSSDSNISGNRSVGPSSQGFQGSNFGADSSYSAGARSAGTSSAIPKAEDLKFFHAQPGNSVSHGNFTATQVNPNRFMLSNDKAQTLSEHSGNIGHPQDLIAGMNLHDVPRSQTSGAANNSPKPNLAQKRQSLDS